MDIIFCQLLVIQTILTRTNFGLKWPYEYFIQICYLQKADISEILTPPRTPPKDSILVRNIVIIELLGFPGNRRIETGNENVKIGFHG